MGTSNLAMSIQVLVARTDPATTIFELFDSINTCIR